MNFMFHAIFTILLQKLINNDLSLGALSHAQKQPPLLMPSINRGCRFLLTEAVTGTASQNQLIEMVTFTTTEHGCCPGWEQAFVPVSQPGLHFRDTKDCKL